jgi:hypothetical protein
MPENTAIEALRRADPRTRVDFAESVEASVDAVRRQVGANVEAERHPAARAPRHRLVRASVAGVTLAAAAAGAVGLTVAAPGGGPGVENATAAVQEAASVTAVAAERSGTADVRIPRDGEPWAGADIRWHDDDLAVCQSAPRRPGKAGSELLVVDGTLYGIDPENGGWIDLGPPESIDPDSGTTPAEYLAAVRDDVGGATRRRLTDGMTGLAAREQADGSTVYSGAVAAGLVARESGLKGGAPIRVLPFGYVAHDAAADPAAPLDAAVTVGADGIVREIAVSWGGDSSWSYTVAYSQPGATPALVAPAREPPFAPRRAGTPRIWLTADARAAPLRRARVRNRPTPGRRGPAA